MMIRTSTLTGYGSIIHCWVSLPLIPELVDGVKYLEPADVKPSQDATELRRHRARGPTLRSLVRTVLACEAAEVQGRKIRRQLDGLDPTQRRERARIMVANGLSQSDTARILGVGRSTIHRDLSERPASVRTAPQAKPPASPRPRGHISRRDWAELDQLIGKV